MIVPAKTWVDLRAWWSVIQSIGIQRDQQKRSFRSTRDWNSDSHIVGFAGEVVFGVATGKPVDGILRIDGDDGTDVDDVDVKTTKYWREPLLKHGVGEPLRASWVALVAMDLDAKRGRVVGVVTKNDLLSAPTMDFGYGLRHTLTGQEVAKIDYMRRQKEPNEAP